MSHRRIRDRDYQRLLAIRTRLRQFEHWSAQQAGEQGLTGAQHQLLLAIRGHVGPDGPTIRDVADYLMIRHNTAVELVDRVQGLGLITRRRDADDHRVVRLRLSSAGLRTLESLSALHIEELARLADVIDAVVGELRHKPRVADMPA